jgi:hypothetical protein
MIDFISSSPSQKNGTSADASACANDRAGEEAQRSKGTEGQSSRTELIRDWLIS